MKPRQGRDQKFFVFTPLAFLRRYPDCERWVPPPATPEEAATLARIFEMLESGIELNRVVVRQIMIGRLYQYGFPDETVTRIRAVLARLS
ncbi:MAG: hypothetical protein Q7T25_12475 [Sideroxyarcus sp.]|nr:hypothetical protein [Sideroxyarcus sp.]